MQARRLHRGVRQCALSCGTRHLPCLRKRSKTSRRMSGRISSCLSLAVFIETYLGRCSCSTKELCKANHLLFVMVGQGFGSPKELHISRVMLCFSSEKPVRSRTEKSREPREFQPANLA